jgi:hypothetical protein
MVELAEVIAGLRRELDEARLAVDPGESLRFELGPVELEATIAIEKSTGGGAKLRFWVVELGGDASSARSSIQRLKVTLHPMLADSGAAPWVSGEEAEGER